MSDLLRPTDLSCDDVREMAGSFVLGALPDAEDAAVRQHLASCSDAHAEMAELGSVLSVLDASVPVVEPPVGLKGRILAAAAADRPAVIPAPIPFPTASERVERSAAKSGPGAVSWILRIAAVLAIVALDRLERAPPGTARHVAAVRARCRRRAGRREATGFRLPRSCRLATAPDPASRP